jgi:hypothetical protein
MKPSWSISRSEAIRNSFGHFAPACFLKPQPVGDDPSPRCTFSYHFRTSEGTDSSGLRCHLGKDRMPYMCSSFPLGEFVQTSPPNETPKDFFVVTDRKSCEGLGLGSPVTISEYRQRNGLHFQKHQREWFNDLATTFAANRFYVESQSVQTKNGSPNQKLTDEMNTFLDLTFGIAKDLWYNFDSLPHFQLSDSTALPWPDLRRMIEEKTGEVNRYASTYLQKTHDDIHSHTSHFEEYLSELTKSNLIPTE